MVRFFYAVIIGLIGAAALHLLIIFLLPTLSANKSWNFISTNATNLDPIELVDANPDDGLNFLFDPLFRHFACKYDLSEGAMRVTAIANSQFWSIAAIDDSGTVFFSANDRIADTSIVDLAIVNRNQLRFVRQNTPDVISNSLVAAATVDEGFVLLRVFTPDESWLPASDTLFESMECEALAFQ